MPRLPSLSPEHLSESQRRVYDVITSTRKGGLGGPFSVWIHLPTLAEPANLMHNAFRLDGSLDRLLFEMLILIVAHEYRAAYVWAHHKAQALRIGLDPSLVEAIEADRRPSFTIRPQEIVYDATVELLANKTLASASYEAAANAFGEAILIEIVSAVGFYSMVCLLVNSFEVPATTHA
jgi:4-carboxymuconolactone decarboxylase